MPQRIEMLPLWPEAKLVGRWQPQWIKEFDLVYQLLFYVRAR